MVIRKFGGPEVLHLERRSRPKPAPHEVLVRVQAADVNAVDCATRRGFGSGAAVLTFPAILGWAFSGVVDTLGVNVTRFRRGDLVYGMAGSPQRSGAYAEYISVPMLDVAFKPRNISHAAAATVPAEALAVIQGLDTLHLNPGAHLAIISTSARVVTLAALLAGEQGLRVVGPAEGGLMLDGALLIGGGSLEPTLRVLKPGARIVELLNGLSSGPPHPQVTSLQIHPGGFQLEYVTQLIEQGLWQVDVDETFPLAAAVQAHRLHEQQPSALNIALTIS
nr:zinc-binding dehydrogenase [Deinococcus apachensis]